MPPGFVVVWRLFLSNQAGCVKQGVERIPTAAVPGVTAAVSLPREKPSRRSRLRPTQRFPRGADIGFRGPALGVGFPDPHLSDFRGPRCPPQRRGPHPVRITVSL
jgi:hypothetical protein